MESAPSEKINKPGCFTKKDGDRLEEISEDIEEINKQQVAHDRKGAKSVFNVVQTTWKKLWVK